VDEPVDTLAFANPSFRRNENDRRLSQLAARVRGLAAPGEPRLACERAKGDELRIRGRLLERTPGVVILVTAFLLAQVAAVAPFAKTPPTEPLGEVLVGVRGDARVYSVAFRDPETDLTASLPIAINTGYHDIKLTLNYLPSLLYSDVTVADDRQVLFQQAGSGRLFFAKTIRRLTLSMFLGGTYTAGKATVANQLAPALTSPLSSSGVSAPTTPPVNPLFPPTGAGLIVPPDTVMKVAQGNAGVGISYRLSRVVTFSSSVFGSRSEGIDYFSKVLSPPTTFIGGSADVSYALTRLDDIATRVAPSYFVTEVPALGTTPANRTPANTTNALVVSVTESYRHRWSARTTGRVSAGINVGSITSTQTGSGSVDTSLAAEAGLDHSMPLGRGGSLTFRAAGNYGLGINQFSGTLQDQVTALGSVGLTEQKVSILSSLNATTSVAQTPATRTISASLVTGYRFSPLFLVFVGASLSQSLLPPQSAAAFNANNPSGPTLDNGALQWLFFGGATLMAPPIFL
jgi:hypothetical protein